MTAGRFVGVEQATIQPIARATTESVPRAGEPYAHVERTAAPIVFERCQYAETEANKRRPGMLGADVDVTATLTLWADDVEALGYEPSAGDRLIQIADEDGGNVRPMNLYVNGPRRSGKLIRFGRQTVVLELTDRAPGRASPEGI